MQTDTETPRLSEWLELVRGEFDETPGLCVTSAEAQELWSLEPESLGAILEVLAHVGFLERTQDGAYLRRPSRPVCA